jgi:hypothetical protein
MSIFTDRELEFLAGLNRSWSRLYWNELALLLKENTTDRAPSAALKGQPNLAALPRRPGLRAGTHNHRPS